MKFIHLSDLHIGKRVNEFSMINDQKYILEQILNIIANEEINAVIVSGDVLRRCMPINIVVLFGIINIAVIEIRIYYCRANEIY